MISSLILILLILSLLHSTLPFSLLPSPKVRYSTTTTTTVFNKKGKKGKTTSTTGGGGFGNALKKIKEKTFDYTGTITPHEITPQVSRFWRVTL